MHPFTPQYHFSDSGNHQIFLSKPLLTAKHFALRRDLLNRVLGILLFLLASGSTEYVQAQLVKELRKPFQKTDFRLKAELLPEQNALRGWMDLTYTNQSADTLHFIWFHLWPNAYKNDQTAFSNQLLQLGRTDFYFSKEEDRGYINQLNFEVEGVTALWEDHPEHIDIIKLLLPQPLPPQKSIQITTPFFVKISRLYSRMGKDKNIYHLTQWYPKPAVFDAEGWHPMPYLHQGEFYSPIGSMHLEVSAPDSFLVVSSNTNPQQLSQTPSEQGRKKWTFEVKATPDIAFFAGTQLSYDTTEVEINRKKIPVTAIYPTQEAKYWKGAISAAASALQFYSNYLGEYPFESYTLLGSLHNPNAGMEYPGISVIGKTGDSVRSHQTIVHEVGHNWFQAALATNERKYPWMDEGMNTWLEKKWSAYHQPSVVLKSKGKNEKFPKNIEGLLLATLEKSGEDLPIETPANELSEIQTALIVYEKAAQWMQLLETEMGPENFKAALQTYYQTWKFNHPQPDDFLKILKEFKLANAESSAEKRKSTGSLLPPQKKKIKPTFLFNLQNTDKIQYLSFAPIPVYNAYDRLKPALLIHNAQLPMPNLRLAAVTYWNAQAKALHGMAYIGFRSKIQPQQLQFLPGGAARKWVNAIKWQQHLIGNFNGSVPLGMRQFSISTALQHLPLAGLDKKYYRFRFKQYFTREDFLQFQQEIANGDTSFVAMAQGRNRSLQQFTAEWGNQRKLYPWSIHFQQEFNGDLWRTALTANYFFNYAKGKNAGLSVRFFAGKIFYHADKNLNTRFENSRFHLNLTGANGSEDYTYAHYFPERNAFQGWSSQQIVLRDGGFKVRTDLLSSKVGKTDDWLMALNLVSTIPDAINPLNVLPIKIPLKVYADLGTYAEAWQTPNRFNNNFTQNNDSKFLYNAGLQVSLIKESVIIYVPVLYSKVYRSYFNSTLGENKLLKTISFSINLDLLQAKKMVDFALE